jgi:hypothetical protein
MAPITTTHPLPPPTNTQQLLLPCICAVAAAACLLVSRKGALSGPFWVVGVRSTYPAGETCWLMDGGGVAGRDGLCLLLTPERPSWVALVRHLLLRHCVRLCHFLWFVMTFSRVIEGTNLVMLPGAP